MQCKYCLTDFFPEKHEQSIQFVKQPSAYPSVDPTHRFYGYFTVTTITCPKCLGAHISLEVTNQNNGVIHPATWLYPRAGAYPPPPPQVPTPIANDYKEANEVLPISPKASAALSRRCLQAILAAHGYNGRDLLKQIEKALDETQASKALPSALRENIDAIRNFGNFSAHPITDQTTLQVVEVEEGEAEWCLELLSDMFEHFYVQPALAAARRAALAEKLSAAGKPPMKTGETPAATSDLVKDGVDNKPTDG